MDLKIHSLNDISKNVPLFIKDGHNVNPHWIINLKSEFRVKSKFGIYLRYVRGYFFWSKDYELFNHPQLIK